jgi:hypothetical protein
MPDVRLPNRGRIALAVLGLALACTDSPTQLVTSNAGPSLSTVSGRGTFANFEPIAASAACVAPPVTLFDFGSYTPFVIATGYTQTILADEIGDFAPVAGAGGNLPDMVTLSETGPHAGRYLYMTHEVGSNGAVTVLDLLTGVSRLVDQQPHYEALDGIAWTPWGTLLFAEERIVATLKDPRVPNAVGGLVYEYDPGTGTTRPLPAVGARSHEGLRFDPQGNLYGISESTPGVNGSGAIFRFVPDRRGDLSSGQLYALKVLDASRTGPAVWVALDRQAVQVNSDAAAIAAGATGWGRPEDVELSGSTGNNPGDGQVMYVASTSEDLVLRIELKGDEALVSNYVQGGVNAIGLEDPDNLALDPQGNLYIAEDRSAGDIWVARRGAGQASLPAEVVRFASLSDCAAEPTGIYFDKNGKTLFVNVQHAGGTLANDLTIAITRP